MNKNYFVYFVITAIMITIIEDIFDPNLITKISVKLFILIVALIYWYFVAKKKSTQN